jgi:hypothetical protein
VRKDLVRKRYQREISIMETIMECRSGKKNINIFLSNEKYIYIFKINSI